MSALADKSMFSEIVKTSTWLGTHDLEPDTMTNFKNRHEKIKEVASDGFEKASAATGFANKSNISER